MSSQQPETEEANPDPEQERSALFAYLVMQQSNMALMLLGKTPHPESGETMLDLDAAKMFIGQLEMLEVKTKGNLTAQEAALLKQSLMTARLAFVEAANAPAATEPKPATPEAPQPPTEEPAAGDDEHRKKFSKKY